MRNWPKWKQLVKTTSILVPYLSTKNTILQSIQDISTSNSCWNSRRKATSCKMGFLSISKETHDSFPNFITFSCAIHISNLLQKYIKNNNTMTYNITSSKQSTSSLLDSLIIPNFSISIFHMQSSQIFKTNFHTFFLRRSQQFMFKRVNTSIKTFWIKVHR